MRQDPIPLLAALLLLGPVSAGEEPKEGPAISESAARAIREAAPSTAIVKPARPRRVLVYGRPRTHPESVASCIEALAAVGRKTGAFEAVASGDPASFLPESLARFDVVVFNNTHESRPLLPEDLDRLPPEERKAAREREPLLRRSLMEFVEGGKGVVGIHGAACSVDWPEYLDLLGGKYATHFTGPARIRPEEPAHPLAAFLEGKGFEVRDEIYIFGKPYDRKRLRVILSLDLEATPDPGKRPDRDYPVSWIRLQGKGRVFYTSLGHVTATYANPAVLRHYLAGIQFAAGDLAAEAAPRR